MATRYFALVMGVIFLLVGVMGFIPAFVTHPADHGTAGATMEHGYLLGLFPVNALHNIVHLAFGLWGVASYRRFDSSRLYARATAVIYGLLTIMGLVPGLNTMFGLVPIHGNDVWLHALIAVAAAYFGFATARDTVGTGRDTVTATDTGYTR